MFFGFFALDEKEIHSFVDIATTNVGESDAERAIVTDFGKSVTGFAPLIYHSGKDDLDLSSFLKFLDCIWKNLENDSNLPFKLVGT